MLSTKLSTFATGACLTAVSMAFSHAAVAAWVPSAPMLSERAQHAGALLDDGTFAVFGGVNRTGFVTTAERLTGNTWSAIGSIDITGNVMEAVTLGTGQVLVRADGSRQARLYDPESNSWSDAGVQSVTRSMPSMTLLANGKVLLAGGVSSGGVRETSAEIYDPRTRTWTMTGSMAMGRNAHAAVLMSDGRVLVTSGFGGAGEVLGAEIYDPVAGTWSLAAPPLVPRHYASMNLLPDGRLLLAGGFTSAGVTNHAELYDPVANTWTATGSLIYPRNGTMGSPMAHATVLPSRKVLIAGGSDGARNAQAVAEVYDPATGTWSNSDAVTQARENGTANLLPSGEVLITGGFSSNHSLTFFANTDRYQPPVPVSTPAVLDPLPLLQRRGGVLTLTGTGFKGAGGTDIPRLELQRVENGFIYQIGFTSHSTTQFVSTPLPDLPAGLYMARLIVAGEPSTVAQLVRFTDPAGAPTGTAGELQIAVSWTAPADDRGNPPVGYEVTSNPASAGCTAVAPSTQCTVSGLTAGTDYTFTVRAKHANGLGPESTSSPPVTPLAAPGPQTINFAPPAPHQFGTTYQPQATATSGLSVSFVVDSGPCVAQQPSGPITFAGVGSCTIRATQPGNAAYQAAPDVTHVLVVEQAMQTLRFNPLPPSTVQVGARYTPVVEGGASANPVIVTASGVTKQQRLMQKAAGDVCTLDAGTVTFGAEGTCTITATQNGNANYAAAQAQSYDITVTPAAVVTQPTPVPSLSQLALMLLSAAMAGLATIGFRRKRLN